MDVETVGSSSMTDATVDQREAPISSGQRLPVLDVLRGFALLGILLANIQSFASATEVLLDIPLDVVSLPGRHHALDVAIMTFQWLIVEGKMRALFGVLFGAGTVLLLDRLESRGDTGRASDIFHRRNMWLILFGILHGALLYRGDILLFYGSLVLLCAYPLRRVAGRKLLAAGLAIWLVGGTYGVTNGMDLSGSSTAAALQLKGRAAIERGRAPTQAQRNALLAAERQRRSELADLPRATAEGRGDALPWIRQNAATRIMFVEHIFASGWIFEIIGAIITGMGLYRVGFLTGRCRQSTYLLTLAIGYAVCFTLLLHGLAVSRGAGFADAVVVVALFKPYVLAEIAGVLANASVVILFVRRRWLTPVQSGLAAVGRMALTNYIGTSFACDMLFHWGPWKLYGALAYYQTLYVVAGMWALNVVTSLIWLRFFAFGPLEWAWRSLTYWRLQPLLNRPGHPARQARL